VKLENGAKIGERKERKKENILLSKITDTKIYK
jgi:hypothetical protein